MNRAFEYNGVVTSPSKPVKSLKTTKKTILIDSADRDTTKYYTNGDFVVYLPRVYENIVTMRLISAEFPPVNKGSAGAGAVLHNYTSGQNVTSSTFSNDVVVSGLVYYFLVELEGLNKTDETAVAAQRSTFVNSYFAKIPISLYTCATTSTAVSFIEYNDHTNQDNVARFTPPLEKLDRLRVKTRLHSQQDGSGFMYWTSDGAVGATSNVVTVPANFCLCLEIEYLENVFDDFSSFETRISERGVGGFGS